MYEILFALHYDTMFSHFGAYAAGCLNGVLLVCAELGTKRVKKRV